MVVLKFTKMRKETFIKVLDSCLPVATSADRREIFYREFQELGRDFGMQVEPKLQRLYRWDSGAGARVDKLSGEVVLNSGWPSQDLPVNLVLWHKGAELVHFVAFCANLRWQQTTACPNTCRGSWRPTTRSPFSGAGLDRHLVLLPKRKRLTAFVNLETVSVSAAVTQAGGTILSDSIAIPVMLRLLLKALPRFCLGTFYNEVCSDRGTEALKEWRKRAAYCHLRRLRFYYFFK